MELTAPAAASAGLYHDLVQLVELAAGRMQLPAIRRVVLPRKQENTKAARFGLLTLEDGSTGFFYALLGDTLDRIENSTDLSALAGTSPLTLARRLNQAGNEAESAIGLAAVNAISHHVFKRAGFLPSGGTQPGRILDLQKDDHIGMVGLFPPLVDRLINSGNPLTILELNPDLVSRAGQARFTLNPQDLSTCDKVLCTASTLINGTLENVLEHCGAASRIALIGPTTGCIPDALFDRGIHVIGSSRAMAVETLCQRVEAAEPWGDAVEKYCIGSDQYPGVQALLDAASA